MRVSEWMPQEVVCIPPTMSLHEAAAILRRHRLRYLPVVQRGTLVGLLSERDLLAAQPSPATTLSGGESRFALAHLPVSQVMQRQVVTVTPHTPLLEVVRIMHERRLEALPVLADGQVVGMLTIGEMMELLGALLQKGTLHPSVLR